MNRVMMLAAAPITLALLAGDGRADEPPEAKLQAALNAVVASGETHFPGAILEVIHPDKGTFAVAAGIADIETGAPATTGAKFRAGSIAKTFVAAVIMQLIEEQKLWFEDPITKLLPEDVTARFPDADKITLRMLLNHTSGIPEWLSDEMIARIAAEPAKVWDVGEFLDVAAAQPPTFAPGQGWAYSNTDYNLLGLIIEEATGQTWREAVRTRIIAPLGLGSTTLPEPGDVAIPGEFMRGYGLFGGEVVDLTFIDPSMAGAAGGGALITTVNDLATFLTELRAGKLFKDPKTFATMADFTPAAGEGGRVGYGFGLEEYALPGGIAMIGHSGGTAGYRSGMFYFPALDLTMTFGMNVNDNPLPVILAGLKAMTTEPVK